MSKNTFLFVLLILIGMAIFYFFQSGRIKIYDYCEESKEIYDLKFKGIVVEKVDATPLFKSQYLLIKNDFDNSKLELNLLHDSNIDKGSADSQFWKIVNVGDSVLKNKGTFIVSYKNDNLDWILINLGFDLCR